METKEITVAVYLCKKHRGKANEKLDLTPADWDFRLPLCEAENCIEWAEYLGYIKGFVMGRKNGKENREQ